MNDTVCNLTDKKCLPCEGGVPALGVDEAKKLLQELYVAWALSEDAQSIRREFKFKNFAKTVYFVNLLIWLADSEMHHPEIEFGYGYCNVVFSTHAINGLSENDFICAAKIDQLVAG